MGHPAPDHAVTAIHPNADLLTRFYTALQRRDNGSMTECYTPEATFQDPVFTLRGAEVGAMWRMLCERGTDLRIEFRDVIADEERGSAHWNARYTFSGSGRQVHNAISSEFRFQNGRISVHRDRFSLYRWSAQALGIRGWLFGWAPPVRKTIRARARRTLQGYLQPVVSRP